MLLALVLVLVVGGGVGVRCVDVALVLAVLVV